MTCRVCGSERCYVHCIYCGADCDLPAPVHGEYCPSITGIYPVRAEDLGHECVHCHQHTPGMDCPLCKTQFKVGDFYCHQTTDQEDVVVVVCLTCAALSSSQKFEDSK